MKTERVFISLRTPINDHHEDKAKFCVECGKLATQEALFSVGGGVTLVEKYCGLCAIIVGGFKPTLIGVSYLEPLLGYTRRFIHSLL